LDTAPSQEVRCHITNNENSTEITIGEKGAKVETKNGDNKTSIEIKDGSTEIEIKKKD
jgi:L,D-peptidoglycan transpeptidase YkuD (ErfK/YbiS/YcfS/YnhG family)